MDVIRIDDPRLDESFSFLFAFKKGDVVSTRNKPSLRGKISDGVYVGPVPKHVADIKPRGKTLYEITLPDEVTYVIDEGDIKKAGNEPHGD
jgi:hypothetical protein